MNRICPGVSFVKKTVHFVHGEICEITGDIDSSLVTPISPNPWGCFARLTVVGVVAIIRNAEISQHPRMANKKWRFAMQKQMS